MRHLERSITGGPKMRKLKVLISLFLSIGIILSSTAIPSYASSNDDNSKIRSSTSREIYVKNDEKNEEILNSSDNNKLKDEYIDEKEDLATNRFIIKYKNDKGKEKVAGLLAGKISKSRKIAGKGNFDVITTKAELKKADLLNELKNKNADRDIEYIQPDYKICLSTNDLYFSSQWGVCDSVYGSVYGDSYDAGVVEAWKVSTGIGAVVAIIDTGIDIEHEDLSSNIWINTAEIPGNSIDDDNNGFIDDIQGWDFCENDNTVHNPSTLDDERHGTHIAGIIAAVKDNLKGIVGVAPDAQIMPLKAFTGGTAYTSEIIGAIEYAEKMGVKIVNCSWGTTVDNPALRDTIANSEMLFVCAAGNNGLNIDINPVYPASFVLPNIITAASINKNGHFSIFSNFGQNSVDVVAPGEEIISTLPGNSYGQMSGTSMSTPFVSGEAAILLAYQNGLSVNNLKEKIMTHSDKISTLFGEVYKNSKVNCYKALYSLIAPDIIPGIEYSTVVNSVYQSVYQSPTSSSFFTTSINNVILSGYQYWFTGDASGDGKEDIIFIARHSADTTVGYDHIALYTEISNGDGTYNTRVQETGTYWQDNYRWIIGDANNDGKSDLMGLVCYGPNSTVNYDHIALYTELSNGDGTYSTMIQETGTYWQDNFRWMIGDANNDGKSDLMGLVCYGPNSTINYDHIALYTELSNGDGTYSTKIQETGTYWQDIYKWMIGDANGDGKSDFMGLVYYGPNSTVNYDHIALYTELSNGDGTYSTRIQETGTYWLDKYKWMIGDANGDRKSDFMGLVYYGPNSTVNYDHIALYSELSNGNGAYSTRIQETGTYWLDKYKWMIGDVNGDEKSDFSGLVCYDPTTEINYNHMALYTEISYGDGTYNVRIHETTISFPEPDIVIKDIVLKSAENGNVKFTAKIQNVGSTAIYGDKILEFKLQTDNGKSSVIYYSGVITTGGIIEQDFDVTGLYGTHVITITADVLNVLEESNLCYNNNTLIKTINVGNPNLSITSLTADPSNPIINSNVYFTARIKNEGTSDIAQGTPIVVTFLTDGSSLAIDPVTYTGGIGAGSAICVTSVGGWGSPGIRRITASVGSSNPNYYKSINISVSSSGETGNNSFSTATTITVGNTVNGSISYTGEEDYYKFTASTSELYTIESTGLTDTYGYLYNSGQSLLYSDNNSGDSNNFKISANLTSGQTYYIKVKGNGAATGSYGLRVTPPQGAGNTYPLTWPTISRQVTLRFGEIDNLYHEEHRGTDIQGTAGSNVISAVNGQVVYAGNNGDYGNVVYINANYNGINIQTRYAHLQSYSVSTGSTVTAGQVIGRMGSTGNVTGTHLHFEILESTNGNVCPIDGANTVRKDPLTYFANASSDDSYMSNEFSIGQVPGENFGLTTTYAIESVTDSVYGSVYGDEVDTMDFSTMGLFDNIRYMKNLDLQSGQAYLRKLVEKEALERYGIKKSELESRNILTYNASTGTATVNLNNRTKQYKAGVENTIGMNGRLIVNIQAFYNYFYPETGSSWIPTSTLANIVYTAGFLYDPTQNIIYSKMYPLQRKFGYCQLYDDSAAGVPIGLSSIIDCEPIYFTYNNKEWMIELWKGQYGLETGAEIGIYNRDSNIFDIRDSVMGKFFNCVSDNERLKMSFVLKKNGTELFRRQTDAHWWLTGFKWGVFTNNPSTELKMEVSITLKDQVMRDAFTGVSDGTRRTGLIGLGYSYTTNGNTVTYIYEAPKSEQPDSKSDNFAYIQGKNSGYVADYTLIKNYLGLSSNDPNLIQESAIQAASNEVKAAYNRIVGWFNSIIPVLQSLQ